MSLLTPSAGIGEPFTDDRPSLHPTGDGTARLAGAALIASNLTMVLGAAVYFTAGVDLDGAAESGTIATILGDVTANSGAIATTYTLWLLAMAGFAVAAHALPRIGRPHPATSAAGALMALGSAVGAMAFIGVLTLVKAVAPAGDPTLAGALVWLTSTGDWVATILIIGLPPLLMGFAGRERWAPRWFRGAGILALLAAGGTAVALLTGSGLTTYGFVLVPVGVATSITMGALLWRRA